MLLDGFLRILKIRFIHTAKETLRANRARFQMAGRAGRNRRRFQDHRHRQHPFACAPFILGDGMEIAPFAALGHGPFPQVHIGKRQDNSS
jgi:hypothetical protein